MAAVHREDPGGEITPRRPVAARHADERHGRAVSTVRALDQPRAARAADRHPARADHRAGGLQRADGVGAEELARYFLICLTFLGPSYVTLEGGQIRMEEFQGALPPRPRWYLQMAIELAGVAMFGVIFLRRGDHHRRQPREPDADAGNAVLAVHGAASGRLAAADAGDGDAVPAHADAAPAGRKTHGSDLRAMPLERLSAHRRFPCLVHARLSGRPGDRHPVHRLRLPATTFRVDLIAQRTLYALDSFPLVAVPVFLFVGSLMNSAGISRHIYRFADTAIRPPAGRPCAGQHLRQPDLRRHVRLGARRHRRSRAHRDRRHALERVQRRVRRRRDQFVRHHRADLPAVDTADHLRHRHRRVGDPAAAGRDHPRPAVRR